MSTDSITCRQSRTSRAILPTLIGAFGLALLVELIPADPFVWVLWASLVPLALVYAPNFTVQADGVIFHFPWADRFNAWDDIAYVQKTALDMRIYAKRLTIFNRFFSYFTLTRFGQPSIYVPAQNAAHFDEAADILRAHLGDRFYESRY